MGRTGSGERDVARRPSEVQEMGRAAVGGAGEDGALTGGGGGDGARRPPQLEEKAARQPAKAEKMGRAGRPIRRRTWVRKGHRRWRRCGSGSGGGDGGAAAVEGMEARQLWRG
ncbi:C-type natriuretic peptide-like [Panicum virgatum]|uniref:C-type natriuretic peptide-like n=1 Tax=Panicum virgatum TaxID=38727 RepID=UPI0019D685E5|nr:C-type natriuretic peptide-like [Panicum virgatum]